MQHRGQHVRLNADSEFSLEFDRPQTERALLALDPDLRLMFNKKLVLFQVMRVIDRHEVIEWNGMRILHPYKTAAWELDWLEGLERGDDPLPLIKAMVECDKREHPELDSDEYCWDRMMEQRAKLEAKAHDNWRHAFLDNRRLLMKAYEPLRNQPAFVR